LQQGCNAFRLRDMTIREPEKHLETRLLDVRLVVHTHWDREWYRPFGQFRARLVSLVDEVLDGQAGSPFLLDGQAIVLEDYLDVRPERVADISNALRQGSLEAGPWYVLADSLIPSGEGLVRNLLAGARVMRMLRAAVPGVLYCPDSFGHPAMLPAIAAGFGFDAIVLWRGYGGRSHPPGDAATWRAPDESSAILYHLPTDGYEFGSHLPPESAAASDRWRTTLEVLGPRAITGLALLTAGADHHAPQTNLGEAISALSSSAAPHRVARSSLAGFAAELVRRAALTTLPVVTGELRDSYGYTWTLQGTFSSRAALKRRYARTEAVLCKDVEPWTALARLIGDGADRRALVRSAWKPVLQCQPHDTLCGCSVDDVATAMAARLDEADSSAAEVRHAALMSLVRHDANDARRQPDRWGPVILVRNVAARPRGGVGEVDVDLVLDDAPVGPASAGIEPRARRTSSVIIGEALPTQELSRARTFAREEASRHYPWNRLVERRRMLVWLPDVPGTGLITLPVSEKRRRSTSPPESVRADGRSLIGTALRIDVLDHGIRLTSGEVVIDDWIVVEVEGERGDLYTRSAIPASHIRGKLLRARVTERGPLRAELTCDWRVNIPERKLTSAAGLARRAAPVAQDVRIVVQLDAGASYARIGVSGDNQASDVRLRIGFATGIASPQVVADAAFGPVERKPITAAPDGKEQPPATAPLHRYVSAYSKDAGATVFSDGLAEYEVDSAGIVWITLLRAVGELSRHNLAERPGHAGYPVETPGAQCLGPFEANFAFTRHGAESDDVRAGVERLADDVRHPLTGETWRTAITPPPVVHGVELSGDGLTCSTIKESEDGEWIVLRCVNVLDRAVQGAWKVAGIREARRSRLDESLFESMPVTDGLIGFTAPSRAIMTILAR
jgi:mannosylglycerate hydrolase